MNTLGQIIAKASGYKYQVDFDKVFIDGNLKGITYRDHVRFVSWQDACLFASRDGLIITPCCGTSAYRQEGSILEAI